MIRFASVAFAVGTAMSAPAFAADVSTATVDGRQINYMASVGTPSMQAPRREMSKDEILGKIRKARPLTPTSNQLDPGGALPETR